MTVWALPSSDLHTTAVRAPSSRASMAARRPAPPAPTTTTSYWCFSISIISGTLRSEEAGIGEHAAGQQVDVEVGEGDAEQRDPGEGHVAGVQPRHHRPE